MKRFLVIALVAGCVPEPPREPNFQQDVLPLLAANCVRCHGVPAQGGAPPFFRLDSFEDTVTTAGTPNPGGCGSEPTNPGMEVSICGARSMARLVALRIRDTFYPMPPRFPLEDYQIETMEHWAQTAERGAPRAQNEAPTIRVDEIAVTDGTAYIRLRVDDLDRDLVSGTVQTTASEQPIVLGALRSGLVELRWDASVLPRGLFPVTAYADDGGETYTIQLGSLAIGVAP